MHSAIAASSDSLSPPLRLKLVPLRVLDYRTKNEKTSLKQRFKEVFRYFVPFYLDSWSGKRDSSPRCAWAISRELYLYPQPLEGASGVASL